MREIKFRGQRKDNNEWVYGYYFKSDREGYKKSNNVEVPKDVKTIYWIFPKDSFYFSNKVEVIPETISQFTGLLDKNGKEIYEGDIIKETYYDNSGFRFAKVVFVENEDVFSGFNDSGSHNLYSNIIGFCLEYRNELVLFEEFIDNSEVISNIHTATEEQLKEWGIEE